MTTTDLTNRDRRIIASMLWVFYLTMTGLAVVCFVGLVVTGHAWFVPAGLAACFGAWCVTGPLDELRREQVAS